MRARWFKAVQQALLLVRLEQENEMLEQRQSDKAVSQVRAAWDALLDNEDASSWDLARAREALRNGTIWLRGLGPGTISKSRHSWEHCLLPSVTCSVHAHLPFGAGIPDDMRDAVWTALASRWREQGPMDAYVELLAEPCIYLHAIKIDIGRLRRWERIALRRAFRWHLAEWTFCACLLATSLSFPPYSSPH